MRRSGTTLRGVSLAQAKQLVAGSLPEPRVEEVDLAAATARVLARDVLAQEPLWPFPRAAMDGIAVRAEDLAGASPGNPVALEVGGAAYCGGEPPPALTPGAAVRIATGAALPAGADAVVRQELVRDLGAWVEVDRPPLPGQHVFPAGEDLRAGDLALRRGTPLHGGHIGLLAALGVARVQVYRQVTVAIVVSGDELDAPGQPLRPGRVRDSNSYALAAESALAGAIPQVLGLARDDPSALEALVRAGLTADCLVAAGGLSVGERDFLRPALHAAGVNMLFEGVALKPGHPASFGLAGERPVFALPGTPGACRVAFEVLVRPALRAMMGNDQVERPELRVRLAHALTAKPGRTRLLWARLEDGPGGPWASVIGLQGSAVLRSPSEADLLLQLEPRQAVLPAGASVTGALLRDGGFAGLRTPPAFAAVIGIVGQRNVGKTTLIELMVERLRRSGVRVGVLKHHAHQADIDDPRSDTGRAWAAGAERTVLAGSEGVIVRVRQEDPAGPEAGTGDELLSQALRQMTDVDLVLVEGFGSCAIPKLLVRRRGVDGDRPEPSGPFLAVVGDALRSDVEPRFGWDDVDALTDYVSLKALGRGAEADLRAER